MAWPNRTRHEQELYRLLNSENEQIRLDAAKELEKIAARKSKARKAKAKAKKTVDPIWDEVRRLEAKDDGDEPFIIDDYPAPVTPVGSSPNAASIADTCSKINPPSEPTTEKTTPECPKIAPGFDLSIHNTVADPVARPKVPNVLTEQAREKKLAAREARIKAGRSTTRVLTEFEFPEPVYAPFRSSGIENRFPFCGSEVAQKWPTWDQENGWTGVNGMTEREYLAKQLKEAQEKARDKDAPGCGGTSW
jgi:hypothetical protein